MSKKLIFLVPFILTLSIGISVTNADLLARYTFEDGSAKDLIGGFNGTFNGDAKVIADTTGGDRGMVLSLDGNGDSVLIPKIAETIEFTYAMWIYQIEVKSGLISLLTHTAWETGSVHWGLNNGLPKIGISGAIVPDGDLLGPDPVPAGEWHHIALVKSDSLLLHYLDGVEVARRELTVSDMVIIGEANISEWSGDRFFHGMMDDLRIYNHALSADEILGAMQDQVWPYAWGPVPQDGAMHFDTWANLSWSPGGYAASHDIYIGDNFEDVDAGADSTFQGNQTDTFLVVGFPGFAFPDGLVPGTTYYWRVDEINDDEPNSPWKGDIWSFSIPPKTAYFPDPADGAESVSVTDRLSWTPGFGAKLHTVYFGETFEEVDNATGGHVQGPTTYNPGTLKMAKTYYWRVDEFDITETHKGNIWSFTTEGAVSNPYPAKNAADTTQTPVLTWTPGFGASHELYFGTDADALELKSSGNLGSESYDPGQLEWNTTYYWRVNEANSANADSPWTGPVWSFTTANFLIIDDFEAYNDLDPADPLSNRIFNAWIDGFDDPTNGSLVGYENPPFAEQTIVHTGSQSMPIAYDNSVGKSEATLTLTSNRDWTVKDVDTLTIWFRGASANAAETLYVTLNGTARINNNNPNAATITQWTAWNIDLQTFVDQGINLTNVNSITIGLGPVTGGSGTMYFDDIRLYPPAP
ncbi:MAG: LamG domain-containing protein [Sedimentisphaerales bacterium]|nr:LamG domain-containing protein [Sedimentisphaerales bacterium]